MIKKVAAEAGLTPKVTNTTVVHEFFQQSNETDWDFAWRLALMHDYEVVVADADARVPPGEQGRRARRSRSEWQDTLISFRPRMSGVQQPKTVNVRAWDPKSKENVAARRPARETSSKPGVERSKVSNDLGGGTTAVTDRVAANSTEATAIANSTLEPHGRRVLRGRRRRLRQPQHQGRQQGQGRWRRKAVRRRVHRRRPRRTATAAPPATRPPSRSPGAPRAPCSS